MKDTTWKKVERGVSQRPCGYVFVENFAGYRRVGGRTSVVLVFMWVLYSGGSCLDEEK